MADHHWPETPRGGTIGRVRHIEGKNPIQNEIERQASPQPPSCHWLWSGHPPDFRNLLEYLLGN